MASPQKKITGQDRLSVVRPSGSSGSKYYVCSEGRRVTEKAARLGAWGLQAGGGVRGSPRTQALCTAARRDAHLHPTAHAPQTPASLLLPSFPFAAIADGGSTHLCL